MNSPLDAVLVFVHFLGLALGFSTSFANATMGAMIGKSEPSERPILAKFPPKMSMLGKIGVTLLWISGLALVFGKWGGMSGFGWPFYVKLAAVVLLTICVVVISILEGKMKRGDSSAAAKIPTVGKFAMTFALTALVFAVVSFE